MRNFNQFIEKTTRDLTSDATDITFLGVFFIHTVFALEYQWSSKIVLSISLIQKQNQSKACKLADANNIIINYWVRGSGVYEVIFSEDKDDDECKRQRLLKVESFN